MYCDVIAHFAECKNKHYFPVAKILGNKNCGKAEKSQPFAKYARPLRWRRMKEPYVIIREVENLLSVEMTCESHRDPSLINYCMIRRAPTYRLR